jgi:hypothetical protein
VCEYIELLLFIFYRVLTIAYNTQNYSVFKLRPSSGVLETRKHNVSETGTVSVLR